MIPLSSEALESPDWVKQTKAYTSFVVLYQNWPTRLGLDFSGRLQYVKLSDRVERESREYIHAAMWKPSFSNAPSLLHREFIGWKLLALAQQACDSVVRGNWEALAEAMDKTWFLERSLTPPDQLQEIDLFYAGLRNAGAWGGRPCNGWLPFVCPPDKTQRIREYLNDQRKTWDSRA